MLRRVTPDNSHQVAMVGESEGMSFAEHIASVTRIASKRTALCLGEALTSSATSGSWPSAMDLAGSASSEFDPLRSAGLTKESLAFCFFLHDAMPGLEQVSDHDNADELGGIVGRDHGQPLDSARSHPLGSLSA